LATAVQQGFMNPGQMKLISSSTDTQLLLKSLVNESGLAQGQPQLDQI
jgi:hypothetical protein